MGTLRDDGTYGNFTFVCPVCGWPELMRPPRSISGGASHEICPCCGYEFGYTDTIKDIAYNKWREKWIEDGMPWRSSDIEPVPANYDPEKQLSNLKKING